MVIFVIGNHLTLFKSIFSISFLKQKTRDRYWKMGWILFIEWRQKFWFDQYSIIDGWSDRSTWSRERFEALSPRVRISSMEGLTSSINYLVTYFTIHQHCEHFTSRNNRVLFCKQSTKWFYNDSGWGRQQAAVVVISNWKSIKKNQLDHK